MHYIRKWYVPGWISLFAMAPLFIFCLTKAVKEKAIYALKVNYPPLSHHADFPSFFITDPVPRAYHTFYINDKVEMNILAFVVAFQKIKQISSDKDTLNGVHFRFSENASYSAFVNTIDILNLGKAKNYLIDEADIWFFYIPQKPLVEEVDVFYSMPFS